MHNLLTVFVVAIATVLVWSQPLQYAPVQGPLLSDDANSTCDCSGTDSSGPRTKPPSICNDARLGPQVLPHKLPIRSLVSDYDRFGGATPGDFLAQWTDRVTGRWLYPGGDGFSLDVDGKPIVGKMVLEVGTVVDRFGSENGHFISAADAPYDQRSLPPANLNGDPDGDYPYNYHIYTVAKNITVMGGPIAPWFGQPGLGAQFDLNVNNKKSTILGLLASGHLEPLHKSDVEPGPGNGTECGR